MTANTGPKPIPIEAVHAILQYSDRVKDLQLARGTNTDDPLYQPFTRVIKKLVRAGDAEYNDPEPAP